MMNELNHSTCVIETIQELLTHSNPMFIWRKPGLHEIALEVPIWEAYLLEKYPKLCVLHRLLNVRFTRIFYTCSIRIYVWLVTEPCRLGAA